MRTGLPSMDLELGSPIFTIHFIRRQCKCGLSSRILDLAINIHKFHLTLGQCTNELFLHAHLISGFRAYMPLSNTPKTNIFMLIVLNINGMHACTKKNKKIKQWAEHRINQYHVCVLFHYLTAAEQEFVFFLFFCCCFFCDQRTRNVLKVSEKKNSFRHNRTFIIFSMYLTYFLLAALRCLKSNENKRRPSSTTTAMQRCREFVARRGDNANSGQTKIIRMKKNLWK